MLQQNVVAYATKVIVCALARPAWYLAITGNGLLSIAFIPFLLSCTVRPTALCNSCIKFSALRLFGKTECAFFRNALSFLHIRFQRINHLGSHLHPVIG